MGRSSAAVVEGAPPACCVVGDDGGGCGGPVSTASQDATTRVNAIKDEMKRLRREAPPRPELPLGLVRHLPIIGLSRPLPSRNMHLRVTLRVPGGEAVTYDTREGRWAEPWGDPDEMIAPGLWALPGLVDGHAHLAQATMDLRPGDLEGAAAGQRWRSVPVWG